MLVDKKVARKSIRKLVLSVNGVVLLVLIAIYSIVGIAMLQRGGLLPLAWWLDDVASRYAQAYNDQREIELPEDPDLEITLHVNKLSDKARLLAGERISEPGLHALGSDFNPVGLMVVQPLVDGKFLYISYIESEEEFSNPVMKFMFETLALLVPVFVLSFLFAIVIVTQMVLKLLRPIARLEQWSTQLTLDDIEKPTPSFDYKELDAVAKPLTDAFYRINQMLEKEQFLLRTTSHELRTPIAVIASNIELLQHIVESKQLTEEQQKPVKRIQANAEAMKQLTETILWLGRDENSLPDSERVQVDQQIQQIIEDNRHLLAGRQVNLQLELDRTQVVTIKVPYLMALSNLIRNAMQYTQQGNILIQSRGSVFMIFNENLTEQAFDKTGSDYGFGLGLALVEKICHRMNWYYSNKVIDGGRGVVLDIGKPFSY